MTNRRNYLVPIIAMMFMLGTVAGVAWAATDSGADSFQIVSYPDTTSVGGDSVNLSIQVLDANGNVNIDSNGQAGDVLFSVSSSIGTVLVPAGAPGAQVAAGPGNGNFATISGNNYAPGAGNALFNIAYGGVSGTDTLTVKMYNSIINNAGAVVASSQIGAAQTVSVAVSEGAGITAIANVAMTNNIDPGDPGTDAIGGGNDATYVDQEETLAGMTAAFQVATNAGGSGDVAVEFVGINQADVFGNNAKGTTVTADCTVVNGQGTFTAVFEKAGYYEIRATANDGAVTYTKLVAAVAPAIVGGRYALRCRPTVPSALKLSINKSVVDANTTAPDVQALASVKRVDQYGNDSGYADASLATPTGAPAVGVSLSASGAGAVTLPAAFNILVNADAWAAAQAITGGATAGGVSIKATATGLTDSNAVDLIVAADMAAGVDVTGAAASAAIFSATIDDGSGATLAGGAVAFGVGQQIKIINIMGPSDAGDAVKLTAGQPVSLKVGGNTLTSSLVAAGTATAASEIGVANAGAAFDSDGDGTANDVFSATFTLPTTAFAGSAAVLEVSNGRYGSFVLEELGAAPWATDGADYAITTNAASGAKVVPLTSNGFELTSYNAGFGGRTFTFPNTAQNGFFAVQDTYGNNVTYAVSGFTGTFGSTNLSAGNGNAVNLGTDAAGSDQNLTWPTSFGGDDTVTLTPISLSGIPAIDLLVRNVGTNAVQSITVTPATTQTLANGIIPLEITTTDSTGRRSSANISNNLIISIESTDTLARLVQADGNTAIANGAIIDTDSNAAGGLGFNPAAGDGVDGRLMIALDSGAQQGTLKVKVQTIDGDIVGESEEITVATNADLAPTNVVGGMDSTDPADVTATANDTVDLYVFTDIDGFTPTSCWVTLSIEGTNFYWVYDEANTAWVRFNFVPEGHADFNASFPTLADAINDYAFTATGANQQVGDDLPMTGMSGLVFKITVWYFDAAGALQSFDYLVTVS